MPNQAPVWWQMVPPGKLFDGSVRFKTFVVSPPKRRKMKPTNWTKDGP